MLGLGAANNLPAFNEKAAEPRMPSLVALRWRLRCNNTCECKKINHQFIPWGIAQRSFKIIHLLLNWSGCVGSILRITQETYGIFLNPMFSVESYSLDFKSK